MRGSGVAVALLVILEWAGGVSARTEHVKPAGGGVESVEQPAVASPAADEASAAAPGSGTEGEVPAELPPPSSVALMDLGNDWFFALPVRGSVADSVYFNLTAYAHVWKWLRIGLRVPVHVIADYRGYTNETWRTGAYFGSVSLAIQGVHGHPLPGLVFGWELRGRLPTVAGGGEHSPTPFGWEDGPPDPDSHGGGFESRFALGGSWERGFFQTDLRVGFVAIVWREVAESSPRDGLQFYTGLEVAGGVRLGSGFAITAELGGVGWPGLWTYVTAGVRYEGRNFGIGLAGGSCIFIPKAVVEGSVTYRF
jgi:hypothetical protein